MQPSFKAGKNIAIKVPTHLYGETVAFYRDILGFDQLDIDAPDSYTSATFRFGDKNLWIDQNNAISQAEIWLEIQTDDLQAAAEYFEEHNITRKDEIEPLPKDFKGFWIASPCNIIHLVHEQ